MDQEIWKPVKGYEGLYEVSSSGRVKVLRRRCNAKNGSYRYNKEGLLKGHISKSGYVFVALYGVGKPKTIKVTRLVAIAFIPNPENKPEVNHKDGEKSNNKLDNLEWNTRSENTQHAYNTGLLSQRGSKNNKSKLTETNIIDIRSLGDSGSCTHLQISKMFNVSRSAIGAIIQRKRWSHI